jgi:hypothetical protein
VIGERLPQFFIGALFCELGQRFEKLFLGKIDVLKKGVEEFVHGLHNMLLSVEKTDTPKSAVLRICSCGICRPMDSKGAEGGEGTGRTARSLARGPRCGGVIFPSCWAAKLAEVKKIFEITPGIGTIGTKHRCVGIVASSSRYQSDINADLIMFEQKSNPAFQARRLSSAPGWYVRVAWPRGKCEHIPGFVSQREAVRWIEERAKAWLSERNMFPATHGYPSLD